MYEMPLIFVFGVLGLGRAFFVLGYGCLCYAIGVLSRDLVRINALSTGFKAISLSVRSITRVEDLLPLTYSCIQHDWRDKGW